MACQPISVQNFIAAKFWDWQLNQVLRSIAEKCQVEIVKLRKLYDDLLEQKVRDKTRGCDNEPSVRREWQQDMDWCCVRATFIDLCACSTTSSSDKAYIGVLRLVYNDVPEKKAKWKAFTIQKLSKLLTDEADRKFFQSLDFGKYKALKRQHFIKLADLMITIKAHCGGDRLKLEKQIEQLLLVKTAKGMKASWLELTKPALQVPAVSDSVNVAHIGNDPAGVITPNPAPDAAGDAMRSDENLENPASNWAVDAARSDKLTSPSRLHLGKRHVEESNAQNESESDDASRCSKRQRLQPQSRTPSSASLHLDDCDRILENCLMHR